MVETLEEGEVRPTDVGSGAFSNDDLTRVPPRTLNRVLNVDVAAMLGR